MRYLRMTIVSLFTAAATTLPAAPHAAAANTTLEAQSMLVSPPSAGRVIASSSASSGYALGLYQNSSASTNLSLPASTSVVIRAKGQSCLGAPHMTVLIDGNAISENTVSATSWTNYTTAATVNAGTHTLSIAFTNALNIFFCSRHLYLDNVTVVEGDNTPPTVPPTGAPGTPTMQPTGVPGNWTMTFDDEFNGTTLDTTKWNTSWFKGGTMNGVTTLPANATVGNGYLTLTMSDTTHGALISTDPAEGANPGFQFTTGIVESRIYFPGNGTQVYNWGAWWTTGHNWPTTGENDIAETLGGRVQAHHIDATGNPSGGNAGYVGGAWHVFTLQRFTDHVVFYYDGVQVGSVTTHENVANSPQFPILNIGRGQGSPTMTGAPGAMLVDYVRAWASS